MLNLGIEKIIIKKGVNVKAQEMDHIERGNVNEASGVADVREEGVNISSGCVWQLFFGL